MCVYVFAIYVCIQKPQIYTRWFSWKIEPFETGFYPLWYLRGKRSNNVSQIPLLGKIKTTTYEGHISCVYTNTHIYTDSYSNTYIPIIWNIHILTHLLWILYLTVLYILHLWKQSFPHLIQATGDCLLTKLKWIFSKRHWFYPDKMTFQDPSFPSRT